MSYLYVKWNSFGLGLLADGCAIKACLGFAGHGPPERRPATPYAARLGRSGGSGQRGVLGGSYPSGWLFGISAGGALCITSELLGNFSDR
jgi:hypothetical protein